MFDLIKNDLEIINFKHLNITPSIPESEQDFLNQFEFEISELNKFSNDSKETGYFAENGHITKLRIINKNMFCIQQLCKKVKKLDSKLTKVCKTCKKNYD